MTRIFSERVGNAVAQYTIANNRIVDILITADDGHNINSETIRALTTTTIIKQMHQRDWDEPLPTWVKSEAAIWAETKRATSDTIAAAKYVANKATASGRGKRRAIMDVFGCSGPCADRWIARAKERA